MILATGPEGGVTEFFYNEQGSQSRIKSGSTNIYQDYDNAGRLTSQTVIGSSKCLPFFLSTLFVMVLKRNILAVIFLNPILSD